MKSKYDHQANYAAQNRLKVRRCFHTYPAMWAAAGELAKRLWPRVKGNHGAGTVVHVALAAYLKSHGVTAPDKIREIKRLHVCRSACV